MNYSKAWICWRLNSTGCCFSHHKPSKAFKFQSILTWLLLQREVWNHFQSEIFISLNWWRDQQATADFGNYYISIRDFRKWSLLSGRSHFMDKKSSKLLAYKNKDTAAAAAACTFSFALLYPTTVFRVDTGEAIPLTKCTYFGLLFTFGRPDRRSHLRVRLYRILQKLAWSEAVSNDIERPLRRLSLPMLRTRQWKMPQPFFYARQHVSIHNRKHVRSLSHSIQDSGSYNIIKMKLMLAGEQISSECTTALAKILNIVRKMAKCVYLMRLLVCPTSGNVRPFFLRKYE